MNEVLEAGIELYISYVYYIKLQLRLYLYFTTNCFSQKEFCINLSHWWWL